MTNLAKFPHRVPKCLCSSLAAALALLVCAASSPVHAVGLTYVDANDLFNLSPSSAINSSGTNSTDNLWGYRARGAGGNVFESGAGNSPNIEDSPVISQLLSSLTPGHSYDLYTAYWTDDDENWTIRTGLNAGSLTLYNFGGNRLSGALPDATPGITAAAAVWDQPPPAGIEGKAFTGDGDANPGNGPDDLVMLLAKAGTAAADSNGQISVYFDDLPAGGGAGHRTWLDGVAYVDAGTSIALSAAINRTTGQISITNPTASAFHIKSYSIDSAAGALKGTTWNTITGNTDGGGNSSFDSDPWTIVAPASPASTPFTTQLSESESATSDGQGGTLASGGTINFGNAWAKTRFEDVRISLVLSDNTVVKMLPNYTGAAIAAGDLDGDGDIDVTDFNSLRTNLHTDIATLTSAEAYSRGDMTGDKQVNFNDFTAFRTAYNAVHGAGAFTQLATGVPEPSGMILLCSAGLLAIRRLRSRVGTMTLAAGLVCMIAATSHAQALLKVDVDSRSGETDPPTPTGSNTVSGFESFTIDTAASGSVAAASRTFASGYTLSFNIFDDGDPNDGGGAGDDAGKFDDRDRVSPDTAPTLNQLYDDFIFAGASAGPTGGIDVRISGGALLPNTPYQVSIYAYDGINSTGGSANPVRQASYFDGNNGDASVLTTTFTTNVRPATDDTYKFNGVAVTDATGQLFLKGRRVTAADVAVYIDGLEVNPFTGLTLEVNTSTGGMRILNQQGSSIDMSYYEIRSASGALNPAGWASLDDAEGSDPVGTGWDEAGGSSASILSEANLTSMSTLSGGASLNLGSALGLGGSQDISFAYAAPGAPTLTGGFVKYVTSTSIVGDFNHNQMVDSGDLVIWRASRGANPNGDADNDGDTDGNDFLIWQRRLGATSATAAAGAIPEPAAAVLLALGMAAAVVRRGR